MELFQGRLHTDPDEATDEIAALPLAVDDAKNRFPGEGDFIILGDLNADRNKGASKKMYFDENDMTSPLRSAEFKWIIPNDLDTNIDIVGCCTYDRIVITKDTTTEDWTGNAGVCRFDIKHDLNRDAAVKISDHFPVYAIFNINTDTDGQAD